MSKELVRLQKERSEGLGRISDVQLRILNNNLRGVLESDPLFRILRRKGDTATLAKFFNRSLSQAEYDRLVQKNRREFLKEKARDFGLLKEGPSPRAQPESEARRDAGGTKALERVSERPGALERVFERLTRRGWSLSEITDAMVACGDAGFPARRLTALAKLGVKPHQVRPFLRAHDEMREVAVASSNSPRFFSLKLLKEIFVMVGEDMERFEDFLDFCIDRPDDLRGIKLADQLGNRGRLDDMRVAFLRMYEIYDLVHGSSTRIGDLDILKKLGPKANGEERVASYRFETARAEHSKAHDIRVELNRFNIPPVEHEDRDCSDGEMNPPRRRRRGGF